MKNSLTYSLLMISLIACQPLRSPAQENKPQPVESSEPAQAATRSNEELAPQATRDEEAVAWELEVVVEGLEVPWSIVFTSPQRLMVSERRGQIREVRNGILTDRPLYRFEDVAARDEAGLMGLAIDPQYDQNAFIYACYTTETAGELSNRVVRLRDLGDRLELDGIVLGEQPSARFHAGCRLGFGPDGNLYITSGDALKPEEAQSEASLAGKILRLNTDGSIPLDNPILSSAVFSIGHRNPQGITWDRSSGRMYASEHGPSGFDGPGGGDEVNLILAGENYGWPLVSHDEVLEGTQPALIQFTPAIAPAAILFYDGELLPMFTGSLLLAALRGEGLAQLTLSTDDAPSVEQVNWILRDLGRLREVVQAPDGSIYFSSSNRDGRGDPLPGDDKIYHIVPVLE